MCLLCLDFFLGLRLGLVWQCLVLGPLQHLHNIPYSRRYLMLSTFFLLIQFPFFFFKRKAVKVKFKGNRKLGLKTWSNEPQSSFQREKVAGSSFIPGIKNRLHQVLECTRQLCNDFSVTCIRKYSQYMFFLPNTQFTSLKFGNSSHGWFLEV